MTDGTTVSLFKNINASGSSNPSNFFAYDGKLYFSATDGVAGLELWQTDGTPENTKMVADFNPGSANSAPSDLTLFNGKIYLVTDNGATGKELYVKNDNTLGTADAKAEKLRFYPNPSDGNIKFNKKITGDYEVYSYTGQRIAAGKVAAGEVRLNLKTGQYLLVIKQSNEKNSFPIFIK